MSFLLRLFFGRAPRATLIRVGILVAVSVVVFGWILMPVRTQGISMLPLYETDGLRFFNRLTYAWREPRRGDIVAIQVGAGEVVYVKRIVGLPGERVRIEAGNVVVNGQPVDEPYVRYRTHGWDLEEIALGPDEFFVVGDNRSMRIEQHTLGLVHRRRIVGTMAW